MKSNLLTGVVFVPLTLSQSLQDAISTYSQLSSFRNLLQLHPGLTPPPNTPQLTVLVPSNNAFNAYLSSTGNSIDNLPLNTLLNIVQYHTLSDALSSAEFVRNSQVLVNTQLTNDTYNHRNGTEGQVVLISAASNTTSNNSTTSATQSTLAAVDTVLSGGGATVNMDVIDGAWSGGLFQIVDGFLTLPKTCTDTMATNHNGLTTLASALVRTNLTDVLNNFANVTCLAPTNVAFTSAGSPDTSLSVPVLADALKFHTIAGAQYSLGLRDGEVLTSVAGPTIKVTVDNDGNIWFNDAKVIQPNVITNNGVIHVLDRIMSVTNSTEPKSSSTVSSTVGSTLSQPTTASNSSLSTAASTPGQSTTASAPSQSTSTSTSGGKTRFRTLFSTIATSGGAAAVCALFAHLLF